MCDVHPSGESLRVSYGVLNLTHRDGHEKPALLVPGERYRVRIQLNDAGSAWPAGHRVRLALSTAYWPTIWPSPEQATLLIFGGTLDLPLRPPQATDALLSPLPVPSPHHPRSRRGSVAVTCVSSVSTASVSNWVRSISPGFTSTRMTRSAQWPSCERSRRCRGMHGKSASRHRCGCRAAAMYSNCREVCGPGKAGTKSVIANGIAPFLEISCDDRSDRVVCCTA